MFFHGRNATDGSLGVLMSTNEYQQQFFDWQSRSIGEPLVYGFKERLAMSQGNSTSSDVQDVLMANIPGAVSVQQSTETEDRSGTDYWVITCTGQRISVDVKSRDDDWREKIGDRGDDLALETFSVIEKGVPGWTRDVNKKTDYILWWWIPTRRWCLVPFRMLCYVFIKNWQRWKSENRTCKQYTPEHGGYHSECTFVPRREVWAEIYKHFGGDKKHPTKEPKT